MPSIPTLPTITVTPMLDDAHAVGAMVGRDGGELTTTGSDGTVYTLLLPAGALLAPARVTMTPLSSLDGLPWGDGPSYGVQLEPSGTMLGEYGRLTITPAGEVPADARVLFGYSGAGTELALAMPDPQAETITLLVEHFSGAGVQQGYLGDVEAAKKRLGGTAEQQVRNEVSALLQAERNAQLSGAAGDPAFQETMERLMDRYQKEVVDVRLAAAGSSCAAARAATETVLAFERQRQLLGFAEQGVDMSELLALQSVCVEEEYALCAEQHIVHRMITVLLQMERAAQLMGGGDDPVVQLARQRTEDCLRFDLEFSSDGAGHGDEGQLTSSMTATVPFRFDAAALDFDYERQTLRNTAYDFTFEGGHDLGGGCGISNKQGDGGFVPIALWWDVDYGKGDDGKPGSLSTAEGEVTGLHLVWVPEQTTESTTVVCPDFTSPVYQYVWSNYFWGAGHYEKQYKPNPDGFWIEDWELLGGETWARKQEHTSSSGNDLILEDTSTFELRHVPQKSN